LFCSKEDRNKIISEKFYSASQSTVKMFRRVVSHRDAKYTTLGSAIWDGRSRPGWHCPYVSRTRKSFWTVSQQLSLCWVLL